MRVLSVLSFVVLLDAILHANAGLRHLRGNERQMTSDTDDFFQLKMFWEKGMLWQGKTDRRALCCECDDDECGKGTVRLQECDDGEEKQRWIFEDGKIKSNVSGKCFTYGKHGKRIQLKPCTIEQDHVQKWDGFTREGKFQLQPLNATGLCMSQHHHPRRNEQVKLLNCTTAELNDGGHRIYDDTSHWVTGKWSGHTASSDSPLDVTLHWYSTNAKLDGAQLGRSFLDDVKCDCKGARLGRSRQLVRGQCLCYGEDSKFGLDTKGCFGVFSRKSGSWQLDWKPEDLEECIGNHLTMKADGDLALFGGDDSDLLWASKSHSDKKVWAVLDGQELKIVDKKGHIVWTRSNITNGNDI